MSRASITALTGILNKRRNTTPLPAPFNGILRYTNPQACTVSIGLFKKNGDLVRQYIGAEKQSAGYQEIRLPLPGTLNREFDVILPGPTDREFIDVGTYTETLVSAGDYDIKILRHNIVHKYQGGPGNTFPLDKFFRANRPVSDIEIVGDKIFLCVNFAEANPTQIVLDRVTGEFLQMAHPAVLHSTYKICSNGSTVFFTGFVHGNENIAGETVGFQDVMTFALNATDFTEKYFSAGVFYQPPGAAVGYQSVIDYHDHDIEEYPTPVGTAANDSYLFISYNQLNKIRVIDVNTGSFVRDVALTSPGDIGIDENGKLWCVHGITVDDRGTVLAGNSVKRYNINSDGTFSAVELTLVGVTKPRVITCHAGRVVVSEDTAQQYREYSSSGDFIKTYGIFGGNELDANVTDYTLYFKDNKDFTGYETFKGLENEYAYPAACIDPVDGSIWLGDALNRRCMKYDADGNYLDFFMYLPTNYNCSGDANDNSRVFSGCFEFYRNRNKPTCDDLGKGEDPSWKLIRNWHSKLPASLDDTRISGDMFKYVVTTNDGTRDRTFATVVPGAVPKLCELDHTADGGKGAVYYVMDLVAQFRPYHINKNFEFGYLIDNEGGLKWAKRTVNGWNGDTPSKPILSEPIVLVEVTNPSYGELASWSTPPLAITNTGKKVVFTPADGMYPGRENGFIAAMAKIGTQADWSALMLRSAGRRQRGPYPKDGYADMRRDTNYFFSVLTVLENEIFISCRQENWNQSQAGYTYHLHETGLILALFGSDGKRLNKIKEGFSGNLLGAYACEVGDDDYFYNNDESIQQRLLETRITGLNTVTIETIPVTITNPAALNASVANPNNLLQDFPPVGEVTSFGRFTSTPATGHVVKTLICESDRFKVPDCFIEYAGTTSTPLVDAWEVTDLYSGVPNKWTIKSYVNWLDSYFEAGQSFQAVDNTGKVIFKVSLTYGIGQVVKLMFNDQLVYQEESLIFRSIVYFFEKLVIAASAGSVSCQYSTRPKITTGVYEEGAALMQPAQIRYYLSPGTYQKVSFDIKDFEFKAQ